MLDLGKKWEKIDYVSTISKIYKSKCFRSYLQEMEKLCRIWKLITTKMDLTALEQWIIYGSFVGKKIAGPRFLIILQLRFPH